MQEAFAPAREGLQAAMGATRGSLELRDKPKTIEQLRGFGASLAQQLGKPQELLRDDAQLAQQ